MHFIRNIIHTYEIDIPYKDCKIDIRLKNKFDKKIIFLTIYKDTQIMTDKPIIIDLKKSKKNVEKIDDFKQYIQKKKFKGYTKDYNKLKLKHLKVMIKKRTKEGKNYLKVDKSKVAYKDLYDLEQEGFKIINVNLNFMDNILKCFGLAKSIIKIIW